MNKKLSSLLTTAIVSGLLASQVAKAEDSATATKEGGDQVNAAEKNSCKGMKGDDKNKCQGKKKMKHKKGKNACGGKNGCGEAKKTDDGSKPEEKPEEKKDQ